MDAPHGSRANELWIIVPAYREDQVVGQVVERLHRGDRTILVVDDGSPDETAAEAAAAGAVVVRHPINRGQGAALQTGFDAALRGGARYLVTFDGDGQHDPSDIDRLVQPLRQGRADVVLGSRFLVPGPPIPWRRRLLLRVAVLFTRWVTGLRVTDTHNGLRAFTADAARRMRISMDRMAHASEILDRIRTLRLRFVEVPVRVRYTEYSTTKGQRSRDAVRILFDYFLSRRGSR